MLRTPMLLAALAAFLLAAAPAPAQPAPDPQPPARDVTAPAANLDVKPRLRLRALERGLRVGYGVDEACFAVARIRVGQKVLANARGSVPATGAGTLRLALTRAGRRALPRLRKLGAVRARVELSATDPAGNRTILGKRVRLGS